MARKYTPEPETGPTIPKQEGVRRLKALRERGRAMLSVQTLSEGQAKVWSDSCLQTIRDVYGSHSNHQTTFIGPARAMIVSAGFNDYDVHAVRRDLEKIERRCDVLGNLIEDLEAAIQMEAAPADAPEAQPVLEPDEAIWPMLHAKVQLVRSRFDGGHYADAVETALKELNSQVKEMVMKRTGKELDGADLMHQAFSPKNPVIVLADRSTSSGESEQQGYMEMFAGAMSGIRNPKAHANITITKERGFHLLFVASLLFYKLDERP